MPRIRDYSRRDGEPKTRVCKGCERRRPIEDYSFHRKGEKSYRKGKCRPCVNAYHVARRGADPEIKRRHKACVKANVRRLRGEVDDLKRGSCEDCGRRLNPWQMQFDHVRGKKIGNISDLVSQGRTTDLWKEIKKCELVCASCHSDRTYQRACSSA